jgi:sec-independent protein translocase protein TatB
MLPDLSPAHILIVVVVALVVVGPKDLPMLLRKIAQFMGKMRGMANEFRASFDEMARQTELDELRKEVEAMRTATQAAIPHDLGLGQISQGQTASQEAEGSYIDQWQASQAAAEPFLPGLPGADPVMTPLAPDAAPAESAPPEAKPAAKPVRARTPRADTPADDSAEPKAPAKPRARKAKAAEDKPAQDQTPGGTGA